MFVLIVAVGLSIGWLLRATSADVAEIGSEAPDFTVEVIAGGAFTLSEALGQPVVLNFWASWCTPCREEIPAISAFADANPEVTVIGVAVKDVEKDSREFAAEIGATYPLALGTNEIEDDYPLLGLPGTYIIDANGTITDIYNGILDENTLTELVVASRTSGS